MYYARGNFFALHLHEQITPDSILRAGGGRKSRKYIRKYRVVCRCAYTGIRRERKKCINKARPESIYVYLLLLQHAPRSLLHTVCPLRQHAQSGCNIMEHENQQGSQDNVYARSEHDIKKYEYVAFTFRLIYARAARNNLPQN